MVKIKQNVLSSEKLKKSPKKSQIAPLSIKSPKERRKSIAGILPTPVKPKKTKNERKSFSGAEKFTPKFSMKDAKENKRKSINTKKHNDGDVSLKFVKDENKNNLVGNTKQEHKKIKPNVVENVNLRNFEDKYNIKVEDLQIAIEGVIQLHSQNPKVKNQLFDGESFSLSVIVNCHKIPSGHPKLLRIPLAHTLHTSEDDICLIVSEVPGIGNKEIEKHVEHYENLLQQKGVTNIKKIITVRELKTEYETFEQKSRLVDLYDKFLVCGKVGGKTIKKCGSIFYKKRKIPTSVKLKSTNLKEHIDKQLAKTLLNLHLNGDSYYVEFGKSFLETSQLVDNIISVIEFLDNNFPGGFNNIKGLHITAPRSTSIPVYISTKNPSEIPKVKVNTPMQPKLKSVKGELTTQENTEVIVKPSGEVIVIREKTGGKRKQTESEEVGQIDSSEIPKKKLKTNRKSLINVDKPVGGKRKQAKSGEISSIDSGEVSKKRSKTNKMLQKKTKADSGKNIVNGKMKNKLKQNKNKMVKDPNLHKINQSTENIGDLSNKHKPKRKAQKVTHLHNEILIEDISTPSPVKRKKIKKNKNPTL